MTTNNLGANIFNSEFFKSEFHTEPYLKRCLSRNQRSSIARLRTGTFPLEIEKGRSRNIPLENRLCRVCETNSIEDEIHFLIHCPKCTNRRTILFDDIRTLHHDISGLSNNDQLIELLSNHKLSKLVANFTSDCYHIRIQSI